MLTNRITYNLFVNLLRRHKFYNCLFRWQPYDVTYMCWGYILWLIRKICRPIILHHINIFNKWRTYVRIPQYIYDIFVSELLAATRLLFIMNTNKKFIFLLICRRCNSALQQNSMQRRQISFALIVPNKVLISSMVSFKIVHNMILQY